MKMLNTPLNDAKIIIPNVHEDLRGIFKETFNANYNFGHPWAQDGISYTREKHTLRGMHTQKGMAKLVQVLRGSVYDVIIDARKESSTYGEWFGIVLSDTNHKQLYVPVGFYHGFMSLTDDVVFQYKMSVLHEQKDESAIHWKSLDIKWAFQPSLVSEKDSQAEIWVA